MPDARPLSQAFLEAARAASSAPSPVTTEDLSEQLEDAVRRGRAAWPDIEIQPERFAAFLGGRVAQSELAQARVEDLFVACACTDGDLGAVKAVEARYFPDVDAALGKMSVSPERADDVKQGLRKLLFVGDSGTGAPPRIGEYRGAGDLRAWLRVTAMRAALKIVRKESRETPTSDDAVLEARAPADDPELAYMKAAYRSAFKEAFQEALDSLDARERTLLKQQLVDGLSVDDLAAFYRVHRATSARWVAAAREKLLSRTRRTFMMRTRISREECESIMRLVRSQLDVSLQRRLRAL